jgi:hypothetical protein
MNYFLVRSGALVVVAKTMSDARALRAKLQETAAEPVEVCFADGSAVPPEILQPEPLSQRSSLIPKTGKV